MSNLVCETLPKCVLRNSCVAAALPARYHHDRAACQALARWPHKYWQVIGERFVRDSASQLRAASRLVRCNLGYNLEAQLQQLTGGLAEISLCLLEAPFIP